MRDSPFLKDNHEDYEEKIKINENRVVLCKEIIPDSYWAFVNQIWSLLINSFQATMDFEIRKKIVINLSRIISFSDGKGLKKIRGIEMISGLLASMINQSKSTMNKELPMIIIIKSYSLKRKMRQMLICSKVMTKLTRSAK